METKVIRRMSVHGVGDVSAEERERGRVVGVEPCTAATALFRALPLSLTSLRSFSDPDGGGTAAANVLIKNRYNHTKAKVVGIDGLVSEP